MTEAVSLADARRIALAAQGFSRPRPRTRITLEHIARTIRRLGLLQIDFVNVLVPAHYLVLFSRLGAYQRSLLDELLYRRREFTEQWAHEASILPVETWPLLRHRMESFKVRPWPFGPILQGDSEYVDWALDQVRTRGELTASDLPVRADAPARVQGAWSPTVERAVLEAHLGWGNLAVTGRRPNFARAYDLAERVLPPEHHGRALARDDAQRELIRLAARAHGIGTANDLADYYRMPIKDTRQRIAELVAERELREVRVEGWTQPAYLHPPAQASRCVARTLLSPFDPVVWYRPRALRLFHFDYRIEIYVPQTQRKWGYYVLPFLFNEGLAARVDLKADRTTSLLRVLAAYIENGAEAAEVAAALAAELRSMATWLGLESVSVEKKGAFARTLAAAVRA